VLLFDRRIKTKRKVEQGRKGKTGRESHGVNFAVLTIRLGWCFMEYGWRENFEDTVIFEMLGSFHWQVDL
jgi:hypothetical protein